MSTDPSVRNKLLAGVAFNLAGGREMMEQQQHPQMEEAPHNAYQMYGPVASLQQSIDEAFHVNPSIREKAEDAPEAETTIMLKEEQEADLLEMTMAQRREILSEHLRQREDQREDTSRRLQAIMRTHNENPFVPDVETPVKQGQSEALRLFLRSACRNYGYRKLELDICGFMTIYVSEGSFDEPLGSVPPEPTVEPADNPCLKSENGNLTLFETDVPDQFGRTSTWMWWKICKPLGSCEPRNHHHHAPDATEEEEAARPTEAWVIIAIPKAQVEVLEESWKPESTLGVETGGDYVMQCAIPWRMRGEDKAITQRRKIVAYRYSRDGVPGQAMSKKVGEITDMWRAFRDMEVDDVSWSLTLRRMAQNTCLAHGFSKIDADWVHVPPKVTEEEKQGELRKRRAEGTQMPRGAKRAGGELRLSGLRNEIHEGDC